MSDLHDFAAAVLTSWHTENAHSDGPILVADLLDRVFPYSLARRRLGIDVSEDYEALALRLIAGQEDLASVTPSEAGELARVTMDEKLPDLAVLQLLRGAELQLRVGSSQSATAPVNAPLVIPAAKEAKWRSPTQAVVEPIAEPIATPIAAPTSAACWNCSTMLPVGRTVKFCVQCGADQRPLVCPHCNEPLEREWKHCPECGERLAGRETPKP
jgi:NADH pyrophosphatase NudC (nudix superfamily)